MTLGSYYIPTGRALPVSDDSRAEFFSRQLNKPGWHFPKGETMLPRLRRQNHPVRVFAGKAKLLANELGTDVAVEYGKEWNRLGPKGRVAVSAATALVIVLIMLAHMQNQALNTQIDEKLNRLEGNASAQQIGAQR